MATELQHAGAAGFLDGEGFIGTSVCTHKTQRREYFQAIVDAAQGKPEPLHVLVDLFGGRVRLGRTNGGCGIAHYWRLYGDNAANVMKGVLPYLVAKRRQAELILEFQTMKGTRGRIRSEAAYLRQIEIHGLCKELNARRVRHAERLSESAPQSDLRMVR
jgi:hypothetical protein